jgi:predicted dehydrogenase
MAMSRRQTRRQFVKQSIAVAGATVALGGTKATNRVLGANERVNVGVCGIHSRGTAHYGAYTGLKDVQVTYLVDPDSRLFDDRSKKVADKQGKAPTCVQDFRKALDDKDLDAVSIATCNHWHSPITIFACMAGKDVYVEKPASHNIHEGRIAVETARKYKRIVQHGTQQRSEGRANEMAAVHSEKFGKLLVSKGYCAKRRTSIGFKQTEPPPSGLDFNMWTGPAPQQPYHANLVHYNWHWFWDFGNGDIGNQGVHEIDIARWAIKGATLPTRVVSLGGRFGYEDQGQTANTQMSVYTYGDVLLVFEVRGLIQGDPKYKHSRAKVGNEYYTTEGMIADGKFYPKKGGDPQPIGKFDTTVYPGGPFGNFINCVRSRKADELNAPILVGHYSAALCHLGNISYRLADEATWGELPDRFGTNEVVKQTFANLEGNLTDFQVPLKGLKYHLGRVLEFDPKAEKFVGDNAADANKMLTTGYRKPFEIPTLSELAAAGA